MLCIFLAYRHRLSAVIVAQVDENFKSFVWDGRDLSFRQGLALVKVLGAKADPTLALGVQIGEI